MKKYHIKKQQQNFAQTERIFWLSNQRQIDSTYAIIEDRDTDSFLETNENSVDFNLEENDSEEQCQINRFFSSNSNLLEMVEESKLTQEGEHDLFQQILKSNQGQFSVKDLENQKEPGKINVDQSMDKELNKEEETQEIKASLFRAKKQIQRPFDFQEIIANQIYFDWGRHQEEEQYPHNERQISIRVVEQENQSEREPNEAQQNEINEVEQKAFRKKTRVLNREVKNPYRDFLAFGKNGHFDFIEKKLGSEYIQNNSLLSSLRDQGHMSRKNYLQIYNIKELMSVWQTFFRRKTLYRALMISRVTKKFKPFYLRCLDRFEEAFRTKRFDYIEKPRKILTQTNKNQLR